MCTLAYERTNSGSGGSSNFKSGGRGPGGLDFLGLGFVLMPLHTYYVFVARVVNKIHNINTVYLLKSKNMRVIQSKFTNTNP